MFRELPSPGIWIECDRIYVLPSDRAVQTFTVWFWVQSEDCKRRQLPFHAHISRTPLLYWVIVVFALSSLCLSTLTFHRLGSSSIGRLWILPNFLWSPPPLFALKNLNIRCVVSNGRFTKAFWLQACISEIFFSFTWARFLFFLYCVRTSSFFRCILIKLSLGGIRASP